MVFKDSKWNWRIYTEIIEHSFNPSTAVQYNVIAGMLRSQIESCAIPVWYSHFRPITFETLFVQLTPDFLAYLLADGVVLPPSLIPSQPQPDPDSSDESEVMI